MKRGKILRNFSYDFRFHLRFRQRIPRQVTVTLKGRSLSPFRSSVSVVFLIGVKEALAAKKE